MRKVRLVALVTGGLLVVLLVVQAASPRGRGDRPAPATGVPAPGEEIARDPAREEPAEPGIAGLPGAPADDPGRRMREEVLRWALDARGAVCLATPDRYLVDLWNVKWHRTREQVPEGALTGARGPGKGADAWLHAMPRGATLHALDLRSSDVTEEGLDLLGGREDLRVLVLSDCPHLRSEDLLFVANLPSLEILVVVGADLDDRALAAIGGARSLRRLQLSGHRITDAGVQHLLGLPKLEELDVAASRVSRASLPLLARMPTLRRLALPDMLPLDRAALDAAR